MDELIAKIDAEIAALTATVDSLRQQLTEPERQLARLHGAKAAIRGEALPGHRKIYARGRKVSAASITNAERIALALESGPKTFSELYREVFPEGKSTGILSSPLIAKSEWFTQLNGRGSAYTLTEAGRNRNKAEAS